MISDGNELLKGESLLVGVGRESDLPQWDLTLFSHLASADCAPSERQELCEGRRAGNE